MIKLNFLCKSYFSYNEDEEGQPIKALHPPTHDDLLLPDPMHIAGPKKVEPEDVQTQWNPDKNITGGGKLTDSTSDLTHDVVNSIVDSYC